MTESAPARPLGDLVRALESRGLLRTVLAGGRRPADVRVDAVSLDSRRVAPGTLFAAIPGQHVDGHEFAPAAVASGAVAVLGERALPGLPVPQLLVRDARPALALAAAWLHGDPSHRLTVVGITGTDGKTTTSYLIRSILEATGETAGMVGTIDVVVGGQSLGNAARATTPEAPELQRHVAAMVEAGDRYAVVEATSHGLAQERVGEVAWDVAVLTNISHEHLEFHRTHEAYRAAKRRLFERLAVGPANPDKGIPKTAVLGFDDAHVEEFRAAAAAAGARCIGYGSTGAAAVTATTVEQARGGLRITVRTPRWHATVGIRLAGLFNVQNTLAAVGVGEALALDPDAIRAGLERVERVPGRMERIDLGQPFTVVIDYAHTPESLGKVLDNVAPLAAAGGGGLICVFGSAGERDRLKRPMMGRVAGERCRLVVVTDEDPRGEDRDAILEEIAIGAEQAGRRRGHDLLLIGDRSEAIGTALESARSGDVVVLCGKGHERTIEVMGGAVPWDEAAVARDALTALGYGPVGVGA